jgi:hypothetical protein
MTKDISDDTSDDDGVGVERKMWAMLLPSA